MRLLSLEVQNYRNIASASLTPGRELTVLFGCTGGKGIDRREGMGNAAGEWEFNALTALFVEAAELVRLPQPTLNFRIGPGMPEEAWQLAGRAAHGLDAQCNFFNDLLIVNKLLGSGVGDQYLERLRALAAETPLEYADLTGMSRALATGFGDSPERMLELMRAIGDAGSAVGVSAADMEEMARAMSRMNSSGKATLEFLNIFQDRGVDVIGMLGEALGKTQGDIYSKIGRASCRERV